MQQDEDLRRHLLELVGSLEEIQSLLTDREADERAKVTQALADFFGMVARLKAGEWPGRSVGSAD